MAYLTEQQLLLLEQLTYLQESSLSEDAGCGRFELQSGRTLGDIFDDYNLDALDEDGYGYTTAAEWRRVIEAIRNDPVLRELKLTGERMYSKNGETTALVYVDPQAPGQAIVTFKGTSGDTEWVDNVAGAELAETEAQKQALAFIESLPYNDITTTGHSKGGNKSNFVALLSDKVQRSVAFDGQGFSKEFIEKYSAEIEANARKLTCFALTTDFVHELLFEIPGADYRYVNGYGVNSLAENHCLSKFLSVGTDGQLYMSLADGESKEVAQLREMANYLIATANDNGDLSELVDVMQEFARAAFGEHTGEDFNLTDWLLAYVQDEDNFDSISLLLAYLLRYVQDYHVTQGEILDLMEYFGIDTANEKILLYVRLGFYLKDQMTDGDPDFFTKAAAAFLAKIKNLSFAQIGDILTVWGKTEAIYQTLPSHSPDSPILVVTASGSRPLDFSAAHHNGVHDVIDGIEAAAFDDLNTWRSYAGEDWYDSLHVDLVYNFVHKFYNGLSDLNLSCKPLIDQVFDAEFNIDAQYAASLKQLNESIRKIGTDLRDLSNGLTPSGVSVPTLVSKDKLESLGAVGKTYAGALVSGAGWTSLGVPGLGLTNVDYKGSLVGYEATGKAKATFDPNKGDVNITAEGSVKGYLADGDLTIQNGDSTLGLHGGVGVVGATGAIGLTLFEGNKFRPYAGAEVGASATALEGSAKYTRGTEDTNVHVGANGKLLTASADASAGIGMITTKNNDGTESTTLGVKAEAGAEAYVASGQVSGGLTIFGIDIDVSAKGHLGGAGASAGGSVTANGVRGEVGIGLLAGLGLEVSIDWSDFELPKFPDLF